ncbi:MAG: hypothetical protein Q4F05_00220 [bacterium]|nr:hypothetical protein [bacterium]
MEKVINVLSEIEDKATTILDRTQDQKQQLYEQLNKDLAKLDSDIKADTASKIDRMQEDMEQDIEKERLALISDCQKQLASLQQTFDKDHNALVNKVFAQIIEV